MSTEVAGIIGALDTFYEAIDLYLAPQTIIIGARVKIIDTVPETEVFASALTCTTSGTTFDNLAGAIVIRHRAAQIGGRYRGRKYLGPLDEAATASNGRLLETACSSAVAVALSNLAAFSTNGVEFGVWSEKFSQFTPTPITSVNPTLGIQRRRLT